MSRNTNEEWERRKLYLVRSLFDNEPVLSPIPEKQELSLDLRSPTEAALTRPYSPLPDLIIEKEPNRHDEPEEYYQDLEKKIKKIYRQLFLKTTTSEDTSTDFIDEFVFRTNIGYKALEETIQPVHSNVRQSSEKRYSQEERKVSDEHISDHSVTNESIASSSIEHSGNKEPADTSHIEHSATNESTNSSNAHSGVNSNSSVESSSTEHNEVSEILENTKSTRSLLEKSDTSSINIPDHEIIVAQAEIHDNNKKQVVKTVSYMRSSSKLDKITSVKEHLPGISHGKIFITQAEVYETDSKQLEEISFRVEPASILDKVTEDDPPVTDVSEIREQSKSTVIIRRVTNTELSESEHEQSEYELESLKSSGSRGSGVHSDDSVDEPEVMRMQDTSNVSIRSGNVFNNRRHSSAGIDLKSLELSPREMEEAEGSVDCSLISSAPTPKSKSQELRYSKRRILSEISTSHGPSKRNKQNLATQTSFSSSIDDENNWEEIRTHFFEGNPCIYKLCTCTNHVCG